MKRSTSVTLTLMVALATARAQQAADPCEAATFNGKMCQAAVQGGGYCSQGVQTSYRYPQSYPYYYDRYTDYLSHGGQVTPSSVERCPRHGFGTTATVHTARTTAGG
jgi:hypothetical protein